MKYFVSFKWLNKDQNDFRSEGSGHTIVEIDHSISSYEDLVEITDIIKSQDIRIHRVVIINWKRMELPE